MAETIVVLGSNSFSGSHFVDHALTQGYQVIGMSRSKELLDVFLPYKKNDRHGNFSFYQYDINHHLEAITAKIKEVKAKFVVNFAAQSMVSQSWDNPDHWYQTNTVATINLHCALRKLPFLERYVHISTPEVYGTCVGLVKENNNYHGSTPYAISRAAADMSLETFYKAYHFPVVFTRAANVYGGGQQLYRIVPKTILFFMLGWKVPLHGGGHSVRSFIHIKDVADGTLKVMEKGTNGEIYHFSTTLNISIRELVEKIARKVGVAVNDLVEVTEERLGKDAAYLLDSSKAKQTLGWKDTVSLDEGIDETIEWVKQNIDVLKKQELGYVHKP